MKLLSILILATCFSISSTYSQSWGSKAGEKARHGWENLKSGSKNAWGKTKENSRKVWDNSKDFRSKAAEKSKEAWQTTKRESKGFRDGWVKEDKSIKAKKRY